MKELGLLAWFLCIISASALAQSTELEYRLFAQEGKTWKSRVGLIHENVYRNHIDGDTLIGGELWKKVYNDIGVPYFPPTYYAAIRDVDKKVYVIAKGSNRPRLLYDFNLKEGDIVMCGVENNVFGCLLDTDEKPDTLLGFPFVSFLKVEHIDIIEAHGLQHRRFILTLLDAFQEKFRNGEEEVIDHVIWIEGVGSSAGPFSPWLPRPPKESFFQSCLENNTCIFGYPDFYENDEPAAIGNTIYNRAESSVIHNLQGITQSPAPHKGIYIQNGKKVVVK